MTLAENYRTAQARGSRDGWHIEQCSRSRRARRRFGVPALASAERPQSRLHQRKNTLCIAKKTT